MKIGILGTRGVPASYSGFETLAEQLGVELVRRGHEVIVYCRRHHITYADPVYRGIKLVKLPTIASKHLDTIVHTFLSLLHASAQRFDAILICGVGNSCLLPLARLLGLAAAINVDGSDYRRRKWGRFARWFLKASEGWAVRFADEIISDSRVVQDYYRATYGRATPYIPYGAELPAEKGTDVLARYGLEPRRYLLIVGRLVPENCIHHLTEAFQRLKDRRGMKLVVVGDAPYAEDYIASLKRIADPDVIFTGYVFGRGYRQLAANPYLTVLASEVGGTHPVLLEAMGFGNCVVVNNTPTNLEVIGDAGFSYDGARGAEALAPVLDSLLAAPETVAEKRRLASKRVHALYSWRAVADGYLEVFSALAGRRQTARR